MAWERVLTVNDYWDGPRRGIAEVSGRLHIYESPFNETKDDYEEFFWVSPIEPDLLALVLEDWDIWNRWSDAFDRGEASRETHPALPQDRTRHDDLQNLIGSRFRTEPAFRRKLWARFRSPRRGWNGMEVEWLESEPTREGDRLGS